MKVLIAVISTRQPPYGAMIDTSKATWDSVDTPDVETIYYVGNPGSPLTDRVLGLPVNDTYANMGHKNLAAWKWMLDNRDFDFMARVNASCFVHKPRLAAHCATLSTTNLLLGGTVAGSNPPWLWGGHQFIMSRDVVQAFVDNKRVWPHIHMDDVALSHAATVLGIPFTQGNISCSVDPHPEGWQVISSDGNNFSFSDWADIRKSEGTVFFRVKQDLERHKDAMIMHQLHDNYFRHQEQAV